MNTFCPLCAHPGTRPSWVRGTVYHGRRFPYVECARCGTHYCAPMPGLDTLEEMYGPNYKEDATGADGQGADPKQPEKVLAWLERLPKGTFVDYGCGEGALLKAARQHGWNVTGIELDPRVAEAVERETGARVLTGANCASLAGTVDVLHLGDTIEHLTDLDNQYPAILQLLKPGGVVLAQGPLEGNFNLFTGLLRFARKLRGYPWADMAPYHVLLATARGQQQFFRRFGLEELEFSVHEAAWPAPARLSLRDLKSPRRMFLFMARRLSQGFTRVWGNFSGNRFFYAGRWGSPTGSGSARSMTSAEAS